LICKSVYKNKFDPKSPKDEINFDETFKKYPTSLTSKMMSDLPIDVNVPFKDAII
jgi:hypothetical protein